MPLKDDFMTYRESTFFSVSYAFLLNLQAFLFVVVVEKRPSNRLKWCKEGVKQTVTKLSLWVFSSCFPPKRCNLSKLCHHL